MNDDALHLLPEQHYSEQQRATIRARLLDLAREPMPRRRRPRRRIVIVSGIAALAVAGGGVATAIQLTGARHPSNRHDARCYSEISTDFGSDFPGTTVSAPLTPHNSAGQTGPTPPLAPIAECTQAWQVGLLWGHAADRTPKTYPVPHLVGCVLPDGTAAVFPGPDGLCQRLGLPSAIPDN